MNATTTWTLVALATALACLAAPAAADPVTELHIPDGGPVDASCLPVWVDSQGPHVSPDCIPIPLLDNRP